MTLERLWAGWRAGYIDTVTASPPRDECLFCGLAGAEPDDAQLLARDDLVFSVLNAYPYTSGHLMVVPVRHEGELDGLGAEEADALMVMTQRATTALRTAYRPDGINVGINLGRAAGAGVPGHVHVHVLPRWAGDTNFLTSVAEARVLPEALSRSRERLRDAWPA